MGTLPAASGTEKVSRWSGIELRSRTEVLHCTWSRDLCLFKYLRPLPLLSSRYFDVFLTTLTSKIPQSF